MQCLSYYYKKDRSEFVENQFYTVDINDQAFLSK